MAKEEFEALLVRMKEIAGAVNVFSSETVQAQAFNILINTFSDKDGGDRTKLAPSNHTSVHNLSKEKHDADNGDTESEGRGSKAGRRKRSIGSGSKQTFPLVKDLDLHPAEKISFSEFIERKKPKSDQDKYAVAIYYLEQVLEKPAITISDISTVFRQTSSWKEPTNLRVGLSTAASRKNTINTADMNKITTTPHGRNFVEHDLPASEKPKK
jgi:hypothetical protein